MPKNLAVLDLGSNSFHMLVASLENNNNLHIIDKLKDRARLAAGLDDKKNLTEEAQERALQYFRQYSERLLGFEKGCVRVVATDTFRKAKNGSAFLEKAETALGWPIEVISGIEEARLIYKGVSHDYPSKRRRLIIDIGGGSTELIIGTGSKPIELASTKMGCVSWTKSFFPNGKMTRKAFKAAIQNAEQVLASQIQRYLSIGWQEALGSSGTNKAIGDILIEEQRSDGAITKQDLEWLVERLIEVEDTKDIPWDSISDTRQEVLAAGASILLACMRALKIYKLRPVASALREGVMIEMVGRIFGEDIRDKSIQSLLKRFKVDPDQNARILKTLRYLFDSASDEWRLNRQDWQLLQWATQLHEVGLNIAFSGYHRHSAYIVKNADLAGFSRSQQAELAFLIFGHRGRIKPEKLFKEFPYIQHRHIQLLSLFRLATRFHRRRNPSAELLIPVQVDQEQIQLLLPLDFLEKNPLTHADLSIEVSEVRKLGIELLLDG